MYCQFPWIMVKAWERENRVFSFRNSVDNFSYNQIREIKSEKNKIQERKIIILTLVTYSISFQILHSLGKSAKSKKLSTTTWPIRSCLENLSKSYTEKWSFLVLRSLYGTVNKKTSSNTGFRVFLCTLVWCFVFLSGSRYIFTYGSEVPEKSFAGRLTALWIFTISCSKSQSYLRMKLSFPQALVLLLRLSSVSRDLCLYSSGLMRPMPVSCSCFCTCWMLKSGFDRLSCLRSELCLKAKREELKRAVRSCLCLAAHSGVRFVQRDKPPHPTSVRADVQHQTADATTSSVVPMSQAGLKLFPDHSNNCFPFFPHTWNSVVSS